MSAATREDRGEKLGEATLRRDFAARYGREPDVIVRAPGRINLLGAHVDYNDGLVLPAAIDRSIWVAAGHGSKGRLRAWSRGFDETVEAQLEPAPAPPAEAGRPRSSWGEYVLGVAWALERSGRPAPGLDAVVASDLPVGAGVSSSAALEVAFLLSWRELAGFALDPGEAARLGRVVENDYLDVQSGIMDQFACLHGAAGRAVFLDCRSLDWELVELPRRASLLVADSGVRRRLVEGGINDRRAECRQIVDELRRRGHSIAALRDVSFELMRDAEGFLDPRLHRRLRHVVEECDRVRRGARLLREAGNLVGLGELMKQSHASSRDLYEVSIPELDLLAETAWEAPGCYGARLAGAGFGGCVTVVVDGECASAVASRLATAYRDRFAAPAEILRCEVGDGAEVWAP